MTQRTVSTSKRSVLLFVLGSDYPFLGNTLDIRESRVLVCFLLETNSQRLYKEAASQTRAVRTEGIVPDLRLAVEVALSLSGRRR